MSCSYYSLSCVETIIKMPSNYPFIDLWASNETSNNGYMSIMMPSWVHSTEHNLSQIQLYKVLMLVISSSSFRGSSGWLELTCLFFFDFLGHFFCYVFIWFGSELKLVFIIGVASISLTRCPSLISVIINQSGKKHKTFFIYLQRT